MALSLSRPKHKSLTNPSFRHLFSSSFYRPNGQFSEQNSNNSQPQQSHKDSASSSFSSSSSNDISNKPVSIFDSLRESLESLGPRRSENSENVNNNRGDTTPELYRRNMMAKSENVRATNESSSSSSNDISNKPVSRVLRFDSIKESLQQMMYKNSENVNNSRGDTTPKSSFMSSLRLKPANENHVAKSTVVGRTTELPENVFGKELNKDKRGADVSTSSEFLKTCTYSELGEKLRTLRPKVKGKDEGWVSPEFNERLRELRKIFEEKKTAATNPGFLWKSNANLRKSLTEVDKKNDEQEQEQKRAHQSLAVSDQLGTTPEFMLLPPKENLAEKISMSMNSSSTIDTQSSKRTRRKWTYDENVTLVSCMVDLHNVGTYNADTELKVGFLNELERMLATKLPNSNLRAKPHIQSRIKTLKKEWSIVYDMIKKDTSGFGWDTERKIVIAEDHVWDSYLSSHKDAAQFRRRRFPFYHELTEIYGEDRATGNGAQTVANIHEEMEREEGVSRINESDEDQYEYSLHEIDESFTHPQTSNIERQAEKISTRRRKRSNDMREASRTDLLIVVARMLGDTMNQIGDKLCKSIGTETYIQQRVEQLDSVLSEIEGLTDDERDTALSKIPDHTTQMLVFFSLASSRRLWWVRRFLMTH